MNKKELIEELRNSGINDCILKAIAKIDRKKFIAKFLWRQAYENYPLSISHGQTISQPYTVAFMLQELEVREGDKVLEIGTGSGWNAALLSYLAGKSGKVYTIEVVEELAEEARKKLKNFRNVKVFNMDGSNGLKEFAPYDRIILTAAPAKLNEKLSEQMKNGGILVAPVGEQGETQKMVKIKKEGKKLIPKERGEFIFVPLVSKNS